MPCIDFSAVRVFHVTVRSSEPANCSGLSVLRYATVLLQRSTRSGKLASLSSNAGASVPASRAAPPLAASEQICTCLASANMSGKRRALMSTPGSIFFASACACAFCSTAARLSRTRHIVGTAASYIEIEAMGVVSPLQRERYYRASPEHDRLDSGSTLATPRDPPTRTRERTA